MNNNSAKALFKLLNYDYNISVNSLLIHAIGTAETLVYQSLISKLNYYEVHNLLDDEGYFYATAMDIQCSTGYSAKQQTAIMKRLTEYGLIETKFKGIPSKKYYHIIENADLIESLLKKGEEILTQLKEERSKKSQTSQHRQNVDACNDKMSKQVSTKSRSKQLQNVDTCIDKMSNKNIYNKNIYNKNIYNKNISINPSINQNNSDGQKDDVNTTLNEYIEIVKEKVCYDSLYMDLGIDKKQILNEIVTVIAETIAFAQNDIKINNNSIPASVVKDRFKQLDDEHIRYVVECFSDIGRIKNIKAYLLTALYNATMTINAHYFNEYQNDLKCGYWGGE